MKRILALAVFVAAACLPQVGLADTFRLTIKNNTHLMIVGVVVRGGQVKGDTRIWSGQSKKVDVTLPHGKCVATIRISFSDSNYSSIDEPYFNLCKYGVFAIGVGS